MRSSLVSLGASRVIEESEGYTSCPASKRRASESSDSSECMNEGLSLLLSGNLRATCVLLSPFLCIHFLGIWVDLSRSFGLRSPRSSTCAVVQLQLGCSINNGIIDICSKTIGLDSLFGGVRDFADSSVACRSRSSGVRGHSLQRRGLITTMRVTRSTGWHARSVRSGQVTNRASRSACRTRSFPTTARAVIDPDLARAFVKKASGIAPAGPSRGLERPGRRDSRGRSSAAAARRGSRRGP